MKSAKTVFSGPGGGLRCGWCEGEGSHEDAAACALPPVQHPGQDSSCAALHFQPRRFISRVHPCFLTQTFAVKISVWMLTVVFFRLQEQPMRT